MFSKYANLSFAIIYAYALYYDYNLTESFRFYPVPGYYWSKLVWLTMINLYLQFFYNVIAAVFAISNIRSQRLLRPFHFFATSLLFPAGFTVVLLFWGLVYLDPSFVMDEAAKIILAIRWFNHSIHTLPLVAMLVDFAIWCHPRPTKKAAFRTIFIFVMLYMIDIHYFFYVYKFWAYPILAVLSPSARLLFILFCAFFIFGAFLVGDVYNTAIHSMWRRQKGGNKKRQKDAVKKTK